VLSGIAPEPSKHDSPGFKVSQHTPSQAGCIAVAQELGLRPHGNTTKPVFRQNPTPESEAPNRKQNNHGSASVLV